MLVVPFSADAVSFLDLEGTRQLDGLALATARPLARAYLKRPCLSKT